jgi:hypothetical protein
VIARAVVRPALTADATVALAGAYRNVRVRLAFTATTAEVSSCAVLAFTRSGLAILRIRGSLGVTINALFEHVLKFVSEPKDGDSSVPVRGS